MIVLDTHTWIFWVNDDTDELSQNALNRIQSEDTLGISIISCWEVAMLVAKERLKLSIDVQLWVNQALKYPGIKLLPIDPEIAVLSTRLPGAFHGDPADRIIVASCMQNHAPLISKDKKIIKWGNINVIW